MVANLGSITNLSKFLLSEGSKLEKW